MTNVVLDNSSDLILEYLNAEHKQTKEVAVKFVQRISGEKNLTDARLCKEWLISKRF
ncbi:MAG: hypothetical protein KDC88_17640 [Ignavibacteriae bacterium]|nr:hypothetical protein [Ignavibacteriota bacterium]